VEKVFPQLVKKDNEGKLSVNYSGFTPLLIKGMQEQQKQIEDLKRQVEELIVLIKK
jgi:trimeric autotransporter adhesin